MDITPVNAWPSAFPVIDDGDACCNAEHAATAQAHADALTYLREGVPGKATAYIFDVPLIANGNNSDRFSFDTSYSTYRQMDVTDQGLLTFHLPVPRVGVLTAVYAIIIGSEAGAHGALPANMPDLRVYKKTVSLGASSFTTTLLGTGSDGSASAVTYDKQHELVVGGLSEALTAGHQYHARIRGESGANASATALQLARIYCLIEPA